MHLQLRKLLVEDNKILKKYQWQFHVIRRARSNSLSDNFICKLSFITAASSPRNFIPQLELQSNFALVFTSIKAVTDGSSEETPCLPGQTRDQHDPASCVPCPANTFGVDGLTCQGCPHHSASLIGSDEVTDCYCYENFFRLEDVTQTDVQDWTICQACPPGSTSVFGATSITQCSCPVNHYMEMYEFCRECPVGKNSSIGSTSADDCKDSGWYELYEKRSYA